MWPFDAIQRNIDNKRRLRCVQILLQSAKDSGIQIEYRSIMYSARRDSRGRYIQMDFDALKAMSVEEIMQQYTAFIQDTILSHPVVGEMALEEKMGRRYSPVFFVEEGGNVCYLDCFSRHVFKPLTQITEGFYKGPAFVVKNPDYDIQCAAFADKRKKAEREIFEEVKEKARKEIKSLEERLPIIKSEDWSNKKCPRCNGEGSGVSMPKASMYGDYMYTDDDKDSEGEYWSCGECRGTGRGENYKEFIIRKTERMIDAHKRVLEASNISDVVKEEIVDTGGIFTHTEWKQSLSVLPSPYREDVDYKITARLELLKHDVGGCYYYEKDHAGSTREYRCDAYDKCTRSNDPAVALESQIRRKLREQDVLEPAKTLKVYARIELLN